MSVKHVYQDTPQAARAGRRPKTSLASSRDLLIALAVYSVGVTVLLFIL